jgi:hypothetical protein
MFTKNLICKMIRKSLKNNKERNNWCEKGVNFKINRFKRITDISTRLWKRISKLRFQYIQFYRFSTGMQSISLKKAFTTGIASAIAQTTLFTLLMASPPVVKFTDDTGNMVMEYLVCKNRNHMKFLISFRNITEK